MSHRTPLLLGVAALLAACCQAADLPLDVAPRNGVLLLRNGQVLQGRISRTGQEYDVRTAAGEIHLKQGEVDLFCQDLDEAYRLKRSKIGKGTAQDHIDLAEWCLSHDLAGHAAHELAAALAADASHPRIPLLERRLKVARQEMPPRPKHRELDDQPAPAELERLADSLPPGAVEEFRTTVQPILWNHCATAGCHGAGTHHRYQLLRMPAGKAPTRRLTQRNLYFTWQWVDPQKPAESPLLTVPLQPHAAAKKPVFSKAEMAKYKVLASWVRRSSRTAAAARANSIEEAEPLLQSPPHRTRRPESPVANPPGEANPDAAPDGNAELDETHTPPPPSSDPFDPAVFNRRFHRD